MDDNDTIHGEGGNDIFIANDGTNYYDGGSGYDLLDFSRYSTENGYGVVNVNLETGVGTYEGAYGAGIVANDTYTSIEAVLGNGRSDTIVGNSANNVLKGLHGSDTIRGGAGNDFILGGGGYVSCGEGEDNNLFGDDGNDALIGSWGSDSLSPGQGNDVLQGFGGNDSFIFKPGEDGVNRIVDFGYEGDPDKIDLAAFGAVSVLVDEYDGGAILEIVGHNQKIILDGINKDAVNSSFFTGSVIITYPNQGPSSGADVGRCNEDGSVTINVLANDSDPEDSLGRRNLSLGEPVNGTVVLNNDGTVTYTPNENFNGTDNFNYNLVDSAGAAVVARVTVMIDSVNDEPTVSLEKVDVDEDGTTLIDVLANASDIDNGVLSLDSVIQPSNGVVVIEEGKVRYTPVSDFFGEDKFKCVVSDGQGASVTHEIKVDVMAKNDVPFVELLETVVVDEDNSIEIDIAAQVKDIDGDKLRLEEAFGAEHGSVEIKDGKALYTPDANYYGEDKISFAVDDGYGGRVSDELSINVNSVNDNPTASLENALLNEDTSILLDVLADANDVEGDTVVIESVTQGSNGVVTIEEGQVKYAPNADYNGEDSFTYTLSDINGGLVTKTVAVNVDPANDNPVTVISEGFMLENTSILLDVLAEATDVDGDTISIDSVTQGANGEVTIEAGKVKYVPNTDYYGEDGFTYSLIDGNGGFVTKTVNISVNSIPIINFDNVETNEDQVLIIDVLANTVDADGDVLSIDSIGMVENGILTIEDNKLKYVPNENFNGSDSFECAIKDGRGGVVTKTINININFVNDTPVATVVEAEVDEGESLTLDVISGVSDVDGDDISIESVTQGQHGHVKVEDGKVVYSLNEQLSSELSKEFNGKDEFEYTVSDGNGGTDTKKVEVVVNPVKGIVNQAVKVDEEFQLCLKDIFAEVNDPSSVTYTATMQDGGSIPDWLRFDPRTKTFLGLPSGEDEGVIKIKLEASDGVETVEEDFNIVVYSGDNPPMAKADDIFRVNSTIEQMQLFQKVAVLNNGSYVVSWQSGSSYGSGSIYSQLYDVDGDAVGSEMLLTESEGGWCKYQKAIALEDGGYGVFWIYRGDVCGQIFDSSGVKIRAVNFDTEIGFFTHYGLDILSDGSFVVAGVYSYNSILVQKFNADGTKRGAPISYDPDNSICYNVSVEIINESDDYVVAWGAEKNINGSQCLILCVQMFSSDEPKGTIVELDEYEGIPGYYNSKITALADGKFVVAWKNDKTGKGFAQVFNQEGTIYGEKIDLGGASSVDVKAQSNGDFVLSWRNGGGCFAGIFDINGDQLGKTISLERGGWVYDPSIAVGDEGDLVASWYKIDNYPDINVYARKFRLYDPDPNLAPDVSLANVSTNEDSVCTIDILSNVNDIDGDAVSIKEELLGSPENGTAEVVDGKIVYTPNSDFYGTDSFDCTVIDENGRAVTQTVNIVIDPVNDVPVVTIEAANVDEDDSIILDVLTGATDVDGDTVVIESVTQGTNGTVTIEEGSVKYAPNPDYFGEDSFTYTLSDGNDGIVTKTVTVNVDPVNDNPVTVLSEGILEEDASILLDVLAEATDIDGDIVTIESVTQGTNGTVTIEDGQVKYVPTADYFGEDSFTYTLSDGNDGIVTKTVTVNVDPVNDNPVTVLSEGVLEEDTSILLDVLAEATDIDGDIVIIESVTQGTNGTVTIEDGQVKYAPNADYNGEDSFTYTLNDGNGGIVTKEVFITIDPVNDAPVVSSIIEIPTVDIGQEFSFDFGERVFTDVDGDVLTYSIESARADEELPEWLNFDSETRSFRGLPDNGVTKRYS